MLMLQVVVMWLPMLKHLLIWTILEILDINPNNCYIWFWKDFDDIWLWCQKYVIENVIWFNNTFNNIKWDRKIGIFDKVKGTENF